MTAQLGRAFWDEMASLIVSRPIVIDQPQGSVHPRNPDLIYPLNYGYLEGTLAADGDGIDVWIGSQGKNALSGILCTYDTLERDAEIKLLLGCTQDDVQEIVNFMPDFIRLLYIPNPESKLLSTGSR